ncbi:MAG: hypothetical protein AB8G22_22425 [Saprospiraceae bacterium]
MKTDIKQINIYYNPEINKHKKTIAHAQSIGKVLTFSFDEMPEAYNVWTTIYNGIKDNPSAIFDDKDERYESMVGDAPMSFDSWYKIATNNPDLIDSPIAIRGEEVVLCKRQTEIYRLMDSERPKKYPQSAEDGTLVGQPLKENTLS